MNAYDAIVIPGGGVRAGGELPPWVRSRLDRAIELAGNALLMPLSAATPHRSPPLDERGFPILEAVAGARYLVSRGVDPGRILIEAASYDTIGNAYFSRVIHAMPRGLRRILVVTSQFHMPRTEAAFRWVYGLPGPGENCVCDFEATPDEGIEPEALALRIAKERRSLESLLHMPGRIESLMALHCWMFAHHGAYSAAAPGRDAESVETY